MRLPPRLAPVILLLTLAACAKDSGRNSVWLAMTNETGRSISDVTLDFGKSSFKYQLFGPGYTYGGYARVTEQQPLTISYTDDAGARQAPEAGAALSQELIGGRVLITLRADGTVGRLDEPRTGPPPDFSDRLDDYAGWIVGAACLLGLPPLVLFLRKTKAVAQDAGTRLKDMAAKAVAAAAAPGRPHAVQKAAAEALGFARKVCPVTMYCNDASKDFWEEGTLDGQMAGMLDHGCLWVGGPDEETLYAFMRGKDGAFAPEKYFSGDTPPVYLDPELTAMIARFSPAVTEVHLLDHAAEALIDWARADAASVQADIRLLSTIRKRMEAGAAG